MKLIVFLVLTTSVTAQVDKGTDGVVVNQFGEESSHEPDVSGFLELNLPKDIKYLTQPPFDYAEALAKSMLFYEAQRSGKLPDNQRVKWRGDSALRDGSDAGLDLSGGYYDGAGYIKYGYTMAFTTTVLSWGVIKYRRTYEILNQLDYALETIKWATDYFIKCHAGSNVFYGQVSDKPSDSQYFGPPESMGYSRTSYKITQDNPGSDLAAETAAAMAAASIVFETTDPDYAATLQRHAVELYSFATIYRGSYSRSIPTAAQAYGSGKIVDDLAWAATWLYRRTGDITYLQAAENFFKKGKLQNLATEFSWNDKTAGVQILLAEVTKKKNYKRSAQGFCQYSKKEKGTSLKVQSQYTNGGLLYINQWGPLRYAANTAFLCLVAADVKVNASPNRLFAASQIDYILGKNGRSFVVGYGQNPPTKIYHKSSYCPSLPTKCSNSFEESQPNAHILYGALVGGPNQDDSFAGQRNNEKQSSVTIDFNAGFQSALAGILDLYIFGPHHRPHIDAPGKVTIDEATLPPPTIPPTQPPIKGTDFGDVIKKSLLFYEAQRSGPLPKKNRIKWRGDSALRDGDDRGYNMEGGYYDGPGYVKYSFPLSFSMTMLSWGLIEYKDAYKKTGQYKYALEALRWGIKYLLKCHIYYSGESTIVGQVGDPSIDSQSWEPPENMNMSRPVYVINAEKPGTELVAEMAAAFAAASIVFEEDNTYSALLYNHSRYLFKSVASKHLGIYTEAIPTAAQEYPSSGYNDELAWAAAWLYEKTRHQDFFKDAMKYFKLLDDKPRDFSWDNKTAGVLLLLGVTNRDENRIATFCNWLLLSAPRTTGGLLYLNKKYPAKYAANAAMLLLLTFEKFPSHSNAKRWRDFGAEQISYLLGSNGRSFMIGFGPNQPDQPFHKASSCPSSSMACGFSYKSLDLPNPHKLVGALVGGPDALDEYEDQRVNEDQSRVSLDGNAGFQTAVAGIQHLKLNGKINSGNSIFASVRKGIMFSMLQLLFFKVFAN